MTFHVTPRHHRIQRRASDLLVGHSRRRHGVADPALWSECVKRATEEEDMRDATPSEFCAICTAEGRELVEDIDGARRAMVCIPCRDEHPRGQRYSFDGGASGRPGGTVARDGNRHNRAKGGR